VFLGPPVTNAGLINTKTEFEASDGDMADTYRKDNFLQSVLKVVANRDEAHLILSVAYFKVLCSEGKLLAAGNRQVLAPFAFMSVLAGASVAIERGCRLVLGMAACNFNY
jgi:hypothetical protein